MRKVREVLRLKHAVGAGEREIAVSVGISRSTMAEYLRRAAVVGITWPVPAGMDTCLSLTQRGPLVRLWPSALSDSGGSAERISGLPLSQREALEQKLPCDLCSTGSAPSGANRQDRSTHAG
jgi:hypothetical protein